MTEPTVLIERTDGVGIVTMNRPEVLNAMNRDLTGALYAAVTELDEDNNRAAQGFWIGEPELGVDLIVTECSLDTVAGLMQGVVPATFPGGTVLTWGRSDYGPFLPFDPTHELGIAAVKGGIVSFELTDSDLCRSCDVNSENLFMRPK